MSDIITHEEKMGHNKKGCDGRGVVAPITSLRWYGTPCNNYSDALVTATVLIFKIYKIYEIKFV